MLGVKMLGDEKVTIEDYPEPIQKQGEILIQIKASGICGSEMHGYRSQSSQPFNGGHEMAGIVIDAGNSKRFKIGDHLGVHAVWGCGDCQWCDVGKYTFCDDRLTCPGTHAERIAAPEHTCLKLPKDIPFDIGVLLTGDGLGVPYHVSQRLNTNQGDVVCIIGAGPIGLGNAIIQSFFGAEVVIIDINPYRLALAKKFGIAHTINSQEIDPLKAVSEITQGMLANKCIEAVGHPETLRLALKLVGKSGTVMAIGEQGDVPINLSENLIRRDITLMGSWFYHYSEYPSMLNLYRCELPIKQVITDHFPLLEAETAFSKFARGETGKVILEP